MGMDKEQLLAILKESDIDRALKPLYEGYGPAVRSEYTLDGEAIVDLDWEASGIVVTLVDKRIDQIGLVVNTPLGEKLYDGWIGDGVTSQMHPEHLHAILELSEDLVWQDKACRLRFEFDQELLTYVVLSKV